MKKFLFICLAISAAFFSKAIPADTTSIEEPIILHTSTGDILGTLQLPDHFNCPVVIIISGSGPTDRDGNSAMIKGKNNSLQQLAIGLANSGIASLRFDKRGIAASSKAMTSEADLRFDNFVTDVLEWISLLKKDKRFTSIIIAGHSEGSLIGMIAANGNADKYISISGAGIRADVLIKEQLETQPQLVKDASFPILDSLAQGFEVKKVNPMLFSLFRPSVQPYMISWFKYDPQLEIAKLKIPVLVAQGDNDIQVSVGDAELLKKSNTHAELIVVKGMNHILKIVPEDKSENIKSYGNPDLPIAAELVAKIVSFIRK